MSWEIELELAISAAKAAGELLVKLQQQPREVLKNQDHDLKLHADIQSEQVIINKLMSSSPYPVLAEETGESGIFNSDDPMWIVDPLDGTLNFSRKLPLYCVSVGLWKGEQPLLGVIYDVHHNELFSGLVGKGAWCDRKPITVSDTIKKDKAVLATGFPIKRNFSSVSLDTFIKRIQSFKKVRLLGSAALSLAFLACGRVDAYTEEDIFLWDVAAGVALVKAAGGWVSVEDSDRHKWARIVTCSANETLIT